MIEQARANVSEFETALADHDSKIETARSTLAAAQRACGFEPNAKTTKVVQEAKATLEILEYQRPLIVEGLEAAKASLVDVQKEANRAELEALHEEAAGLDAQVADLARQAAQTLLSVKGVSSQADTAIARQRAIANRCRELGESTEPADPKAFARVTVRELLRSRTSDRVPLLEPQAAARIVLYLTGVEI